MAEEQARFAKDDFFKIDPEAHLIGDMEPINHFPGVQMWWRAIDNIRMPLMLGVKPELFVGLDAKEIGKEEDPAALLEYMDKYGVDIACLLPESMMDTTGYTSRWMSNGEMAKVVETNPDRFMYQPNISPIKFRGVKNTIWELEYWVKEKGAKIFKFYPPEDTYINDPDLWPFYEKAEELGIVLDIHTGFCWVPPGKSKYALPVQLDDVARDFPDLKIIAFHMGYPVLRRPQHGGHGASQRLPVPEPAGPLGPERPAQVREDPGRGHALRGIGPHHLGHRLRRLRRPDPRRRAGLARVPDSRGHAGGLRLSGLDRCDRANIFGLNLARLLGIEPTRRIRGG